MRVQNKSPSGQVLVDSHLVSLAARLGVLARRRVAQAVAWGALDELNGLALATGADLEADHGRLRRVFMAASTAPGSGRWAA